jgi:hypothetical protein
MSTATAAPTQGSNPLPFLAALGLAVAGYLVVVNLTNAFGLGKDSHLLRVAALAVPLFVGGVIAFWPGRAWQIRVGVLLVAMTLAGVGWLLMPCEFGGPSLADAVAQRNGVREQIATPPSFSDAAKAEPLAKAMSFASNFPSLAETVQPQLDAWAKAAAEQVAERLRTVPPDSTPNVELAAEVGQLLGKHLPQTREIIATAERDFSRRSADFWAEELQHIPPESWKGFRHWVNRRDQVKSILPNGDRLAEAENAWVERTIDTAIDQTKNHLTFRLTEANAFRENPSRELLSTLEMLKEFSNPTPDNPVPFRAGRQRLFRVAFEVTQNQVAKFLEAGAYDRAHGLARTFAVNWSAEAALVGPAAVRELESLRDGCAYLATLAEKVGFSPDVVAPVPRTKP